MVKEVNFENIGYQAATFKVDSTTKAALEANYLDAATQRVDVVGKNLAVKLTGNDTVGFGPSNATSAILGVYTLTLTVQPSDGDKIKIGTVEYEFVETPATGKVTIGATLSETASNLETAAGDDSTLSELFTIANSTDTITYTQKAAGVGDMPNLEIILAENGTLEADIETTTDPVIALSTADALFGIIIQYEKDGYASVQYSGFVPNVPTDGEIAVGTRTLAVNDSGKVKSVTGVTTKSIVTNEATLNNEYATIKLA